MRGAEGLGACAAVMRKGKKIDPMKSFVADPKVWDTKKVPQTGWRFDLMKRMTYTQFWNLVRERRIDKVSPSLNLSTVCASLRRPFGWLGFGKTGRIVDGCYMSSTCDRL